MIPVWRRIRLWATLFTVAVGVLLVFLATIAPSTVRGEARVLLVMIGIILPAGFYGVFTLVGWQKSANAGITPPPIVARPLKWGGAQAAPIVFILLLLGLFQQVNSALERKTEPESAASVADDNYRFVRDSCVSETAAVVRKDGDDPESAELKPKIAKYCGCMAVELPRQFTPAEFQKISAGQAPTDKQQKFQQIMEQCRR